MTGDELNSMTDDIEVEMPGKTLRETREAQGLTVGEVAGAIKFSPRQIEALERDDFDLLQGTTFLRGFVRAYARMLKLQPEPLLALLEQGMRPVQEQVIPPANMGETEPAPLYRRHGKKLFSALVLVTAVAGLSWFFSGHRTDTEKVQPDVAALPTQQIVVPAGEPASIAADSAQTANNVSGTASDSTNEILVAPIQLPQNIAAATAAVDGMSATAAQIPTPPPLPKPLLPTVTFEFSSLSWLEVKDASGQVLVTGEFPAGHKQAITGKPPYQLWIGKASVVKVTYKDQPVDLQPFARDDVARLTLDR
jgi:cytoskeleton protein RodZ